MISRLVRNSVILLSLTHVVLHIVAAVLREGEPPLAVLFAQRRVLAGQLVLELQTGGRTSDRTATGVDEHIGQRLEEFEQIVGGRLFEECASGLQFIFVCAMRRWIRKTIHNQHLYRIALRSTYRAE